MKASMGMPIKLPLLVLFGTWRFHLNKICFLELPAVYFDIPETACIAKAG